MHDALQEAKTKFWESDFYGVDACPDSFIEVADDYIDSKYNLDSSTEVDACGCWMSIHNYDMFAGPYQDLPPEKVLYDVHEQNLIIQGIVAQTESM